MAWTDHAAAMEEGVAARDDLRTSLGQAYLLRRCTELAAPVHARFAERASASRPASAGVPACCCTACSPPPRVVGVALVVDGHLVHRRAGHAVPGHHHVRRPGRPARPAPARPAGGLRRGDPAAGAAGARAPSPRAAGTLPAGALSVRFARPALRLRRRARFALQRRRPHDPGRHDVRPGRSHRIRQVHAGLPAVPRGRARARARVLLGGVDVRAPRPAAAPRRRSASSPSAPRSWPARSRRTSRSSPTSRATTSSAAVAELGLTAWVAGLPDGLDTLLGPGGTSLSAGEEQLVAFARLLVRDVRVVVLDEATARMDPVTEARVVRRRRAAARRSHRHPGRPPALDNRARRAGRRARRRPGRPAGRAGTTSRSEPGTVPRPARRGRRPSESAPREVDDSLHDGRGRHRSAVPGAPPPAPRCDPVPGLARATMSRCCIEPRWGLAGVGLFLRVPRSPARSARSPAGSGATSSPTSSTASTPSRWWRRWSSR